MSSEENGKIKETMSNLKPEPNEIRVVFMVN